MHHIPVLAARHRHAAHGKVFIQHVKSGRIASTPTGYHRRAYFHGLVNIQGAEEQTVHKGYGPGYLYFQHGRPLS